jgi:predicted nucleotidyltransferase
MKLTKQEQVVIADVSAGLKKTFKAEKVLLFGSAARGELDQYSDIDILAVLPERTWDIEKQILDLCIQAERHCSRVISTILYSSDEFYNSPLKESPLVLNAIKQGRPL